MKKSKEQAKEIVIETIKETNNCYSSDSEWQPIVSVRKQLNYILESLHEANDRILLSDVNIGLYAVREFENQHDKLANLIYEVVEIVDLLKKGKL